MLQQDNRAKNLLVLTLHSQMASSEHKKAFEPTRPGFRQGSIIFHRLLSIHSSLDNYIRINRSGVTLKSVQTILRTL